MFKSAKWRSTTEKKITNAVFKFQFHATQVSKLFRGDELVLSLVPSETGKPTAKLEKCKMMRENGCYWENPVYETVQFIHDPKTGKIQDRIYHFVISTGLNKSSVVEEFSVNMADYLEATKACSVSFPFKNSGSDAHFHVLIRRVQENSNLRDFEESEDLRIRQEDRSLRRHFSNGDVEESLSTSSIEGDCLRKSVSHMGPKGTRRGSSGSDITLSSSESSSGVNTPREIEARNSNAGNSGTDYSMCSPRDAFLSDRSQMGTDDSVEKLRGDIVALSRRAEMSELELQTLRKQVVKEGKRGQDLVREITALKQERDALKDECEKLKASGKRALKFEGDPLILLEEIRQELNYEKDMNVNLRLQLQKTQESNAELILVVQDLEEMLERDSKGMTDLPNRTTSGGSSESTLEIEESVLKNHQSDDEEQKALEALVRQHSNAQEAYLLERKVMDLCSEIEMYRRDKDELEIQMEQLALDYEILKQQNHELSARLQQSHLQEQLKVQYECSGSYDVVTELEAQKEELQNELNKQSKELSDCLATIKELEASKQRVEEELRKQALGFEADKEAVTRALMEQERRAARAEEALSEANGTINELTTQKEKLNKELKKLLGQFADSLATIQKLETRNHDLEEQIGMRAEGFEADMEALVQAKTEQEQRALQAEEALAKSNASIIELENHINQLENELKKHSEESSDTLATINQLKSQIQNLEEELEKQAEGFEADLEAVSRARVEQEQRAIRAEEALKLMKWKNANTAARIQDEFKRLSSQMQSSFEVNEKLARKAFSEAGELRMQNRHLHEMLQKTNEELQSVKDEYETRLQEMCTQLEKKSNQLKQMVVEIEGKSKQLEDQKNNTDGVQKSISTEKTALKTEIERLVSENKSLTEQAEELRSELEKMKAEIKERDNEVILNMQSQMDGLRAQCDELTHSLYEDELEKERLRKQVYQLKSDLKKKDDAILNAEKKLKENSARVLAQDRSKTTSKTARFEPVQRGGSKEASSKEVVTLKERIKLLEEQIKSKDATLETSANAFLSKEKGLSGKIEELERRLGELSQSSLSSGDSKLKEEKVSVGLQVDSSVDLPKEASSSSAGNLEESKEEPIFEEQQAKFDILLKEMLSLKEKNKSMETELKEMQERYSEISLKFAEVEGERQQLVMNLRNLKNAKKN